MKKKMGTFVLALAAMLIINMMPVQATETDHEAVSGVASISGGDSAVTVPDEPSVSGGDTPAVTPEPDKPSVSGGDVSDTDLSGKTINLALVIDTTGSMSGYIAGVVDNLSDFVRYIESTGVNFRLSLVDYRDITCGEETAVHTFNHSVWSTSTEEMIAELQSLWVDGGGDYEETTIDALGYLVDEETMTFNSDAVKFAVVLTDAPYKNDNTHGIADMDDMISRLNEKGIRVSVMTDEYCFDSYKDLTGKTGGILASVTDFAETLKEFALSIIKAAEDTDTDTSIVSVSGIVAEGPAAIRPDYAYSYSATVKPENATNKGVIWYSEDETIAKVLGAKGNICYVAGVAEGSTRLIAVSADGGYTSGFEVTVDVEADIAGAVSGVNVKDETSFMIAVGLKQMKTVDYTVVGEVQISTEAQKVIFGAIKGSDKTISIACANEDDSILYKWSFKGMDITDTDIEMDFAVQIGTEKEEIMAKIPEDVASLGMDFSHSGKLPGKSDVTVAVGSSFATDRLYLYYYNPETQELELAADNIIVTDGYATFPLLHCSDYVLTARMLRDLVPTQNEEVKKPDTPAADIKTEAPNASVVKAPKTGDVDIMSLWAMMLGSLTCLAIAVRRKNGK